MTRLLLKYGIVIPPSSMIGGYQQMAQHTHYFTRLCEKLDPAPARLDEYRLDDCFNNAKHTGLIVELNWLMARSLH